MEHIASSQRYDSMQYNRCGNSGLRLPAVSLGLWQNFGELEVFENSRAMLLQAFDLGINHFDQANNYGPPPGSAEETLGRIMAKDLKPFRDEIIISTKAGHRMWPGPYGDGGSRKYLISSLDQSLRRMGLEYVDIFYHHRPDPDTPLEETIAALEHIVRSGRALYAGISNYSPEDSREAAALLRQAGTPCLIHQASYNMFNRWVEEELLATLKQEKIGCIVFSPLAQGMLTDKYIDGIPESSRVAKPHGTLSNDQITPETLERIKKLNNLARQRGQSLAQMALAWVLRNKTVTSALIGASNPGQIQDAAKTIENSEFTTDELQQIETALSQ